MRKFPTKILTKTLAIAMAGAMLCTTGIVVNATELPNVEKTTNAEGNVVVTQTENPTEYTTVAEKVEEALPEVSAEPVLNVNSVEEIKTTEPEVTNPESLFSSCRLIITSAEDMEFKEESLGVDNIKSVTRFDDKYIVEFRSCNATEKAFNFYTGLGYEVEIDIVQDKPEGVDNKDARDNEVGKEEIASTDEVKPTQPIEQINRTEEQNTIIVAILDTGLNDGEEIFNDKVVQGKNFVDENDTEVMDVDTHGTTMSRIVLESVADENTNNSIKVMPIKVLNDEGKGTTLSAYKGIKYVIEKKKENPSLDFVINLSMSGIGKSKLLESAINEAYNNNIPVVVSAGNDNKEITEYTPANINSAFTITSSDKNEDKITKAVYSNYGREADYTTSGHYEYSRNIDDRKVVTKVDGTSVSSAYVSSYIALLKQMALSDDNEDNDNLSIVDIDTSLSESAIATNDLTLGNGYLAKENIQLKKVEEEVEQEALPVEEIRSENLNEGIELGEKTWSGVIHVRYDNSIFGPLWHFTNNYGWEQWGTNLTEAYNNAMVDLVWNLHHDSMTFVLDHDIYVDSNCIAWLIHGNGETIEINGNGHQMVATDGGYGLAYDRLMHIEGCPHLTISNMVISGRGWGFIANSEYYGIGALVNVLDSTCTFNNVTFMSAKNHRTWSGDMSKPLGGGTGVNFRNSNITFNGCNFTELSGCAIYQVDSDLSSNVTLNSCGCSNVSELYSQTSPDITWNHTLTINGGNYYIGYCDGVSQNYVTYQGGIAVGNGKNSGQHKVDITNATIIAGHPSGGWGAALNMYDVTRGCNIKNSTIKGKPSIEANRNTYVTIDNSTIDSFASNSSYVYSNGINIGSNADKRTCTLSLINNSKVYSPEIGINNFGTTSINKSSVSAFQGIVNESGFCTLNISNTSKIIGAKNTPGKGDYAAFTSGIINKGVTNISNSTVKDCMSGIINYGNMFEGINISTTTITNSTISNEIGIENYGMCNFNSGQITNCYYGVQNQEGSTFNQNGGNIYNNGHPTGLSQNNCSGDSVNIGILQDGTYNYSAGYIANNSVKLGANKTINLVGNVQNSIVLTTALNDRKVGRALVSANNTNLANANESKFRLAFEQPEKDDDNSNFSGLYGAVRAGSRTDQNGDKNLDSGNNVMYLSGLYTVDYDGLQDNNNNLRSKNPDKQFTYWKELYDTNGVKNEKGRGELSKVYNTNGNWLDESSWIYLGAGVDELGRQGTQEKEFIGWTDRANWRDLNAGEYPIYTTEEMEGLNKNKTFYAVYRRGVGTITYHANGAVDDKGKEYADVVDDTKYNIAKDNFGNDGSMFGEKQTEDKTILGATKQMNNTTSYTYFEVKKGEVINSLGNKDNIASFQGWSAINYAGNSNTDILYKALSPFLNIWTNANAVLDLNYTKKPIGLSMDKVEQNIVDRSDVYKTTPNMQWNSIMETTGVVNAYAIWDLYPVINTDKIRISSKDDITDELILKQLEITDEEDGKLKGDSVRLEYDKDQLKAMVDEHTCYSSITVYATDSAGNTTRKVVVVAMNQTNPLTREQQGFVRLISREYYNKPTEAEGGCVKDSVWYKNQDYVNCINSAFDNLENDNAYDQDWYFTHKQVIDVQKYIKDNGFGKTKSNDSLKNFHNKYAGEGCLKGDNMKEV